VDTVSVLETALGAELLRAEMLGAPRPRIGDRYVVAGFVGRGATGLVVSASDETLARRVALKLSPVGADATIAEEARALAKLDHPNVVRIFDAIATDVMLDGKPFRVWAVSMQLVEGVTMRAWLRDAKPVPSQIVRVMRDAGAGLAAAHAQRIVHRDFKPENVLIRADGVAQVIDFGFAVPQRSSVGATTSDIAGTAPYLAPEAKLGHATPRSDQFAFGITLVEALTGDPTPPGQTPPSGVSRGLWRLARRACAPHPEARYPDMASLLAELDPAKADSRWRAPSATALVVVALLFGGQFAWRRWNERATPPPTTSWTATPASAVRTCPTLPTIRVFHTTVTRIDDRSAPPNAHGCYRLSTLEQNECTATLRVDRTGFYDTGRCRPFAGEPIWDEVGVTLDGSRSAFEVILRGNRYQFDLDLAPGALGGTFDVRASDRHLLYGGTVFEPEAEP
jgi:hypothetical protein